MKSLRQVALCVDDFGLKPEVNEAVVRLADAGIVTTVGCMSTGPAWAHGASALRGPRRSGLDVGLHLNLTDPMPHGENDLVMPLPRLIVMSLLRALPMGRLIRTIEHQLDRFVDAFGELPDFIDGHQHVHQMPQVRLALMTVIDRRARPQSDRAALLGPWKPWLRRTTAARGLAAPGFKHRVIESLGATALHRLAAARKLPMNRALLGVYGFDGTDADYRARLKDWLAQAQDGDLLMMHPAVPVQEPLGNATLPPQGDPPEGHVGDGIARAREVEYAVLAQEGRQLLIDGGVQPVRLSRCSGILNE